MKRYKRAAWQRHIVRRVSQLSTGGVLAALVFCTPLVVQAQVPSNPSSYSRTSSFTYYGSGDGVKYGLLKTEEVEGPAGTPANPGLCLKTSHDYDATGNRTSTKQENCTGATGLAVIAPAAPTATAAYAAVAAQTITVGTGTTTVAIAAGIVATTSTNAQGHIETRKYDPRFGAVLEATLSGMSGMVSSWRVDDFGRKTVEQRPDGTRTVVAYCVIGAGLSTSSNSSTANGDPLSCPTPAAGEAPDTAVSFVHSEPHDAGTGFGAKMGPYVRVYSDRLGREVRTVTESFNGAGQTSGRAGVAIAQDSVYNAYGARTLQTQAYFLVSGSSSTTAAVGANDMGATLTDYDALGRPLTVYVADAAGSQTINFGAGYGGSRKAAQQSYAYDGFIVTLTNDKGQDRTEQKNSAGQTIRVTDASGAQVSYQYDAFGNLIKIRDALQNLTTLAYDIRGRKVSMSDPDSGLWTYDYDALGQLVRQQNPKQQAASTYTTMSYDAIGRMTQRVEPEYTSSWTYDSCTNGVGRLCQSTTTNGVTRKNVYDTKGRPLNSRVTIASGPSFASAVAYDATTGRIANRLYPTGVQVNYTYTANLGYLEKLTLGTAVTVNPLPATVGGTAGASVTLPVGNTLWQARIVDARGQLERQYYSSTAGGAIITSKTVYDPATGRVTDRSAGIGSATTVLDQHYTWDSLNNLTGRTDDNGDGTNGAVDETFTYGDSLNRLTAYQVSGAGIPGLSRTVTLDYNALGMLLYKSDVGNYTYPTQGGVRPHALQSVNGALSTSYTYDANGNLKTANAGPYRTINYTSFNLPDNGTGISGPSGTPKHGWLYDESHSRIKETRVIASGTYAGTRVTWALHADKVGGLDFESEVNSPTNPSAANPAVTSNRHYLSAGGQVIGVLVTTGALPTLAANDTAPPVLASTTAVKVEYWHKDHLGSTAATTDHASALTARYAYDPFGKRRATNGSYDAAGAIVVDWSPAVNNGNDRGFTGHEHLDDVGLVHMNGRVFDPRLGVFLQADPLTQDPYNLQGFNRYGYCLNNPLTCTDPSGLSSWTDFRDGFVKPAIAIAVAVMAPEAIGWLLTEIGGAAFGAFFAEQVGSVYVVLTPLGNYTAVATAGFLSGAIASGNMEGALQGAFTAAAFYGAGDLISGTGAFAGTGGVSNQFGQAAIHGVVGCVTSEVGGGKCGPGAASAAFSKFATVNGFVGKDVVSGTITSAVIGGTAAELGGGKFANGAMTAAFGYLFNEVQHCMSGQNCMKTAGYEPTYYRSDGILCNGPGDPSCRFPGVAGSDDAGVQAGFTLGHSAGALLGAAQDIGPSFASNGSCAIVRSTCLLLGPFAGYSLDVTPMSIGGGQPGDGWQVSVFGKWATPIGGAKIDFSLFGSPDGGGIQLGRSWGQMYGGGIKACIQTKEADCH